MLSNDDITLPASIFLKDPVKKVLLLYGQSVLTSSEKLMIYVKSTNVPSYYFDLAQSSNIENILANIPYDQLSIFVLNVNDLENPFLRYELARWECKVIILCDQSLLHPTLDPTIYFAPFKDGKVQRRMLSKVEYRRAMTKESENIVESKPLSSVAPVKKQEPSNNLRDYYLNKKLMTNDPVMMQMFADQVLSDPSYKQFLFKVLFASRDDENMKIAAANAISVLIYAKVSFAGMNLSRVRVPGADLRNGIFHRSNLSFADLTGVNLGNANLDEANLTSCLMDNVEFGEFSCIDDTHEDFISAVKYSPDGKFLAVSSVDGKLSLWFVDKGLCHAILEENAKISNIAFSPDNTLLVFTLQSKVCIVHFKENLGKRVNMKLPDTLIGLAFSSTLPILFVAGEDNIYKWNYKNNQVSHVEIPNNKQYRSFALSSDGRFFAAGNRRGIVDIYETDKMSRCFSINTKQSEITVLCFSVDNNLIASGSTDNTICISVLANNPSQYVLTGHTRFITALEFSPDGKFLLSGSWDETVRFWHLEERRSLTVFQNHSDPISCLSFHPSGLQCASGSKDKTVRRWDLRTVHSLYQQRTLINFVYCLAINNNRSLVATASDDFTIRLWQVRFPGHARIFKSHQTHIRYLNFSNRSDRLVSVDIEHNVFVWDTKSAEVLFSFNVKKEVTSAHFNRHDPSRLIIVHTDNTISLWSNSGLQQNNNKEQPFPLACKVYDLYIARENAALLNDEKEKNQTDFRIMQLNVVSPDGNYCAFEVHNNQFELWDIKNKKKIGVKSHLVSLAFLTFSPSSQLLVSTSHDGVVNIWQVPDLRRLRSFEKHTDTVTTVAFDTSETIIASSGHDKIVYVWNRLTGQVAGKMDNHFTVLRGVFFAEDNTLVSGGRSLNQWRSQKENLMGEWYLEWTSHPELSSRDCRLDDVRKLSYNNLRLLKKTKAEGNPIDDEATVEQGREVPKQLFEETLGNLHGDLSKILDFMKNHPPSADDSNNTPPQTDKLSDPEDDEELKRALAMSLGQTGETDLSPSDDEELKAAIAMSMGKR